MEQQTRGNMRNDRREESNVDKAMAAAKDKAQPVKEKANEIVDETKSKMDEATRQAKSALSGQKEEAAGQLHGLAQALRETSGQLRDQDQGTFANYSNQVADQIDRVSSYLQDRDVNDLMRDAEDFARRQPELFIGGAFTLGLLAARFMKSSASDMDDGRTYSSSSTRMRNTAVPEPRVQIRGREGVYGERPYYSSTEV